MLKFCLSRPFRSLFYRAFQHQSRNQSPIETFYDILKVKENCTSKEIREAFVNLSKQFHPDVKQHANHNCEKKLTESFVKISEAYQTLSKPKLRSQYDRDLWARGISAPKTARQYARTSEIYRYIKPWEVKPNIDTNPGAYYYFTGIPKQTNAMIAAALLALGLFGCIFGFASVSIYYYFRSSHIAHQMKLDETSAEASLHHAAIRADAEKYGNEEQIRRLMKRIQLRADEKK